MGAMLIFCYTINDFWDENITHLLIFHLTSIFFLYTKFPLQFLLSAFLMKTTLQQQNKFRYSFDIKEPATSSTVRPCIRQYRQ